MFKLYSKGCEYTLRALIHFPSSRDKPMFSPAQICSKAKIPKSYTQKIFQSLTQQGLLNSSTGPGGGYSLSKDPKDITLLSIIEAVDGHDTFERCVMGLDQCNEKSPCPIHHTWKRVQKNLVDELSNKTLKELIDSAKRKSII